MPQVSPRSGVGPSNPRTVGRRPFAVSQVIFAPLCDNLGFRFLLRLAFLGHLLILALLAAGCGNAAQEPEGTNRAAPPSRPNILFAIADDVSYPHMSAYGTDWVETPAFDRVATEGLLFLRAYTPNDKCAPSRAAILTGRNSWQLEAAANHWAYWPDKFKSWVEVLKAGSYFVGHTGKGWAPGIAETENGEPRYLAGQPFNEYTTEPPTEEISNNDYAANFQAFLEAVPEGRSFAFWYGAIEPHRSYAYSSGLRKGGKELDDINQVPPFWPDVDSVRTDMLDYAYELEHFDRHLGRMLALLEEQGELENTLVVVTSDNGMPFPRAKGEAYEIGSHLPLAIMWKAGIENPGRAIEDHVSFIDFAPTFLEVGGVSEAESGMEPITGRSLTGIFYSEEAGRVIPERDHVLIGKERHEVGRPHDGGYPIRGIVADDYLYLHNFKPERWPAGNPVTGYLNVGGSPTKTVILDGRTDPEILEYWQWSFGKRPKEELYRIASDPACIHNLADDPKYEEIKNRLKEPLFTELKEQGDPRMFGKGYVFDEYPYTDATRRNFYERYMSGELDRTDVGWVNPSDFEEEPIE